MTYDFSRRDAIPPPAPACPQCGEAADAALSPVFCSRLCAELAKGAVEGEILFPDQQLPRPLPYMRAPLEAKGLLGARTDRPGETTEPAPASVGRRAGDAAGEIRIKDPATGGEKGQKAERYDLFPFDALDEVARVYGAGAQKYSPDNWLRGYSWRLSAGALLRHVARFMCGESMDAETGCHHLACAAWHCLTLMTFEKRKLGTDDRRPPGAP